MGWEEAGRLRTEGAHVYLCLIHDDVWQKPTQYCKATILQLKINNLKKRKVGEEKRRKLRLAWGEGFLMLPCMVARVGLETYGVNGHVASTGFPQQIGCRSKGI